MHSSRSNGATDLSLRNKFPAKYLIFGDYPLTKTPSTSFLSRPLRTHLDQSSARQDLTSLESQKRKVCTCHLLFNANQEPLTNESRILIPSAKVASFDQKPEICTVTKDELIANLPHHQLLICNFANADGRSHWQP